MTKSVIEIPPLSQADDNNSDQLLQQECSFKKQRYADVLKALRYWNKVGHRNMLKAVPSDAADVIKNSFASPQTQLHRCCAAANGSTHYMLIRLADITAL